jgi:RNA polymerase sigma-70 factor (ECF subfamily)
MINNTSNVLKSNDGETFLLQYFRKCFLRYYEPLCIYVYHFIKDRETSEDLVQEVFVELWEKRSGLNYDYSLKPLLYKCAHDKTINYLKSPKCVRIGLLTKYEENIQLEYLVGEIVGQEVDSMIDYQLILSHVNNCVAHLPPKCQEVFKMSREKGLSNKEIAQELSISIKAVEKQITKALFEIKKYLSREGFLTVLFYYLINNVK